MRRADAERLVAAERAEREHSDPIRRRVAAMEAPLADRSSGLLASPARGADEHHPAAVARTFVDAG